MIELRSVIDDSGEKELHIVKQLGHYFQKGRIEVLTYVEEVEGSGDINNFITITPDKVNINRSGAFTVNRQFLLHKKTECLYQHPHGNIHMTIKTRSITHRSILESEKGQLVITYEAILNGQVKRDHHLTLTYYEEEKNESFNKNRR